MIVTDRQTIYTHPATGAQTRLLTITEKRRNRPMALADALAHVDADRGRLLVNAKSGRAAVQVPAPSLMLDDGEIERRVRLIRPMEHFHASLKIMADSHWEPVDRETFAAVWEHECAEVPAFEEATLHIVAGLLLPVWKRLPNESTRVYRLQTDDGERIIGRRVSPAWRRMLPRPRERRNCPPRMRTGPCSTGGRSSIWQRSSSFAVSASWARTGSN